MNTLSIYFEPGLSNTCIVNVEYMSNMVNTKIEF